MHPGYALLHAPLSSGQVATGTPPFSSVGGGPFDTVNLGNLNVHFAIPVLHKAGRGMPFVYDLSYDSSVWTPVTVSGTKHWQPDSNWGWRGTTEAAEGYVYQTATSTLCRYFMYGRWQSYYYTVWHTYGYGDQFGVFHPAEIYTDNDTQQNCGVDDLTGSAYTTDGSGYTVSVVGGHSATVTSNSGQTFIVPITRNNPTTSGTVTDANGNQITQNTSGQIFDTLSSTTPVFTISSVAPPTPTTFTYIRPDGNNATYTINYKQYTVATNFGVSGISEYPATTVYLVDNIALPDGSKYTFAYEATPTVPAAGKCTPIGSTTCVTARISEVVLNTGGTIAYTYSGGSNGIESDGSTAGLGRQLSPGGTWSYSRTNISGAHWQTTINDPATPTNQTVIDFQEDSATTNPTHSFFETQRVVYQGSTSGTLLSTTITCYNGNSVSTPANCPSTTVTTSILRTTVFKYLPNSSGLQAETDTTFDNSGLTHEVDEYDYGPAAVGGLIRRTITVYATLGNNIVDRPSSVTIEDSGNNVKAYTSYAYDETTPTPTSGTPQHISVTGSRGLLTSVSAQANATTNLYRKYTYYDTGTLSTSTDVSTSSGTNGAATTYTYASGTASCGNSFVTSITEPLGLSRSMTWDCNGGVMLSLTDENSETSSAAYTGSNYTNYFWRPYSTTDQAGTVTDYFYYLNTGTPPQPFQTESKNHTAFNSGNSIVDLVTTSDGFGRTIFRQTKQSPTATSYDTVATCYDSSGRVSLTTMPYSAGIIAFGTSCPSSNAGNSNTYDALNRVMGITNTGGGSTAFSYNKNDVLQTISSPSEGRQQEYDALGRLTSVCEITNGTTSWPGASCGQNTSATGYLTKYAYDVLGDLTNVTQNAQASTTQTRTYVYDMLGRMTSEANPETAGTAIQYSYDSLSSDASCGSITSAGNLLKRLDAASNAACYSGYDALHRLGTTIYPSTSTPARYFVYDAATVNGTGMTNAKTRLAEAYTCTGTCSSKITDLGFSYSPTGKTSDTWESTLHSGGYYHLSQSYWPNGAVSQLSGLPSLPTMSYGVDGEGRESTVSASSGQNPVTAVTYATSGTSEPIGALTQVTFGSGDSDTYQYDTNTGKMKQYSFNVNGQSAVGNLAWNTNGTAQSLAITDPFNSQDNQTCSYSHDDLGRVSASNCGSVWSQTFAYDPFGNVTKSGSVAWQPGYDTTSNRYTLGGTSYDANGNLKTDTFNTYTWNADGTPASFNGSSVTYDALGRMVENNNGTFEYVYAPNGQQPLATMQGQSPANVYLPLPGDAFAMYNSSGLFQYNHGDWLGSARVFSTPSRAATPAMSYAPFGEGYAGGQAWVQFTGAGNAFTVYDTENQTGSLEDFLFRRYSPVQGRWISPDPAGLSAVDPTNPQTWNRYAYLANNPLNGTDPKGLYKCVVDGLETDHCGGWQILGGGGGGGGNDLAACPGNVCSGFGTDPYTGQPAWLQFTADAAGNTGYLSLYDWTQGVNGINGTFLSNAQYFKYLKDTYAAQISSQCGTVSSNLSANSAGTVGTSPSVNCGNVNYIQGSHANFQINCGSWNGGNCAGRWPGGLHIETDGNGNYWAHNDTASPYIGSSFNWATFNPWNLFVHGTVDLIGGTWFNYMFNQ